MPPEMLLLSFLSCLSSHCVPFPCAVWLADTSSTDKFGRPGSSSNAMPVHAVLMPNFAKKKAKEAAIQPGVCRVVQKLHLPGVQYSFHLRSPLFMSKQIFCDYLSRRWRVKEEGARIARKACCKNCDEIEGENHRKGKMNSIYPA